MSTKYIRRVGTPLALSIALVAGACARGDNRAGDTALARDTALNRDLQLAGRDTAAQPQLQDVPATTGGATTTPRTTTTRTTTPTRSSTTSRSTTTTTRTNTPATTTTTSGNTVTRNTPGTTGTAAAGGGAVGTLPAGTTIDLASSERVCTNTHKAGDRFTATVSSPVTAGGVTIPAGATAVVTITQAKRSENANDAIVFTFAVNSISYGGKSYPIQTEVTYANVEKVRNQPKSKDVQKVVGGAVVGAAIGQILGKNTKSTVIGAATGAAAGTAVAMGTANYEGCIPSGGRISVRLTQPAQVRAE
jgi:hypothetical protein